MNPYGFLAIWCDMAAEDLEDYRNWLTQEHIADRTFLPGFLGSRLFEALDRETSHFILYATASSEVLASEPYLAALNAPSPWTRRIMPRFGPFDRAAGVQAIKVGNGFGPCIVAARLTPAAPVRDVDLRAGLEALVAQAGIVSARLMSVDQGSTDIATEEKTMRTGGEGDFTHLLCLEAMNEDAARAAAAALPDLARGHLGALSRFDATAYRMIYGEAPHEGPTRG